MNFKSNKNYLFWYVKVTPDFTQNISLELKFVHFEEIYKSIEEKEYKLEFIPDPAYAPCGIHFHQSDLQKLNRVKSKQILSHWLKKGEKVIDLPLNSKRDPKLILRK